jgi:hypothetical protein
VCWQDNIVRVYSIATAEILLELVHDSRVFHCYLDQHNRIWIIGSKEISGRNIYFESQVIDSAPCSIIDMYTSKIICKFNIGLHLLSISMIKLSVFYVLLLIVSLLSL